MKTLREYHFMATRARRHARQSPTNIAVDVLTGVEGGVSVTLTTDGGYKIILSFDRDNAEGVAGAFSAIVNDHDALQFVPRGPVLSGRREVSIEEEAWRMEKDDVA